MAVKLEDDSDSLIPTSATAAPEQSLPTPAADDDDGEDSTDTKQKHQRWVPTPEFSEIGDFSIHKHTGLIVSHATGKIVDPSFPLSVMDDRERRLFLAVHGPQLQAYRDLEDAMETRGRNWIPMVLPPRCPLKQKDLAMCSNCHTCLKLRDTAGRIVHAQQKPECARKDWWKASGLKVSLKDKKVAFILTKMGKTDVFSIVDNKVGSTRSKTDFIDVPLLPEPRGIHHEFGELIELVQHLLNVLVEFQCPKIPVNVVEETEKILLTQRCSPLVLEAFQNEKFHSNDTVKGRFDPFVLPRASEMVMADKTTDLSLKLTLKQHTRETSKWYLQISESVRCTSAIGQSFIRTNNIDATDITFAEVCQAIVTLRAAFNALITLDDLGGKIPAEGQLISWIQSCLDYTQCDEKMAVALVAQHLHPLVTQVALTKT